MTGAQDFVFPEAPKLQTLPPRAARLCLRVERFNLHCLHLPRNSHILLALSGGADSTALALILHVLAPRLALTLRAMTLDHGLRPEASQDAAHVLALCRTLHIPCSVHRADVARIARERGMGLEEAGRHVRYTLLEKERQKYHATYIALGHHAEDLTEDILLRLIRGVGWPALGGMRGRDETRHILRPLLASRPQELKKLLKECAFHWRTDMSNTSRQFRRNRLRLDVLPLLRRENPSLEKSSHNLWQLAELDQAYWNNLLDAALQEHPWQKTANGRGIILPAPLLRALPPAARLRLYMRALRHLAQAGKASGTQARAQTLLALDQALSRGRGNTRFQLAGAMEARLKKGSISFQSYTK